MKSDVQGGTGGGPVFGETVQHAGGRTFLAQNAQGIGAGVAGMDHQRLLDIYGDERQVDAVIRETIPAGHLAFLRSLPRNKLNAGSSEILNWVAVAGAVEHLDLTWFDYVPGYRTPAGTGTGLSFAAWS